MTAGASPWLTIEQAAQYAQLSTKTLWRACADGKLRHARVGGRRSIRIKSDWVTSWLESSAEPVEVRRG